MPSKEPPIAKLVIALKQLDPVTFGKAQLVRAAGQKVVYRKRTTLCQQPPTRAIQAAYSPLDWDVHPRMTISVAPTSGFGAAGRDAMTAICAYVLASKGRRLGSSTVRYFSEVLSTRSLLPYSSRYADEY